MAALGQDAVAAADVAGFGCIGQAGCGELDFAVVGREVNGAHG